MSSLTPHAIKTHGLREATSTVATYAGASVIVFLGVATAFWGFVIGYCLLVTVGASLRAWYRDDRPFLIKTPWQYTLYFGLVASTLVVLRITQ